MSIFINIVISLIVAFFFTAITFFVIARIKGDFMNMFHGAILICIFLFVFVQSFLFMGAWDAKTALQDLAGGANTIIDSYIDFANQFEDGQQTIDELSESIGEVDVNPILRLFGFEVNENGINASPETISYYNSYMWHRVLWALGVIILYIVVCIFALDDGNNRSRKQRYHRSSSRRRRHRI